MIGFFKVVGINKIRRIKSKNYYWDKSNLHDIHFLILIPVFKEEKIIKDTTLYFKALQGDNVEVYYITTDKEISDISNKNPTLEVLSKNIDKKYIINYPHKTGDKANQLNYAIKRLLKKHENKNLYFGIFDADSKPDLGAIQYISSDKVMEPIYQMLSVYNTNYNEIPLLCKANAVLQTRWSFYFEFNRLLQNHKNINGKKLMYLIGHGIFIRGDIIRHELFPENSITEDISYGYKLFLGGIFAKPIPSSFDYCSVPKNIKTNINQISRRFYGEFELILGYILKHKKSKILFFQRLIELIIWGYGGIIVFIIFLISTYIQSWELQILIFFGLLLDFISFNKTNHIFFNHKCEMAKLYLFSMIKNILDSIPLSISLINLIWNYLTGEKERFNKTDR